MVRATLLFALTWVFALTMTTTVASFAAAPPSSALATIEASGPDLPPVGRSLFDDLLEPGADGKPQVPFPFTALLQRIEQQLDSHQPSGGLSVVLIPLGRSLQRHAAGDVDAFRYPRVVAAVTGEPPANAPAGHAFLRDRLYVAYHEKAAALEVISYNEAAGRFEFQLVRNYRAGAASDVGYANRTLCLACHHNAAPIFSRQSWDETSASPPVAARLAATGLPYYGLNWHHGVDVPDAIDTATARANLLSITQRLWREGCAAPTHEAAVACRAESLRQALRYRLTDGRSASFASAAARQYLVASLLANWQQRWPAGLAIADPSLPNRQPFAGIEGGQRPPSDDELRRYADIGAAFDPLALRAPLEVWRGHGIADVGRFIHALSLFFSRADIALIDRQLATTAPDAPVRHLDLSCTEREAGDRTRLDLDCRGVDGARLQARVALKAQRMEGGTIDRLVLPGNDHVGAVMLDAGVTRRSGDAVTVRFPVRRDGRSLRAAEGDAIRHLSVTRTGAGRPARVSLELAADLAALDRAIDTLADATLAQASDVFADRPMRRAVVLPSLFARLGDARLLSAVANPGRLSSGIEAQPHLADPIEPRATPWPPELQPFLRQCSQCHAAPTAFPPGFLRGDDERIRSNLAGCAERMLYRLAMNARPPAARLKTPMPPPAAAHAAAFAQSADLPAMTGMLEQMLAARAISPATVLARPYATLAPCVASPD
jgi:hypothetical protein